MVSGKDTKHHHSPQHSQVQQQTQQQKSITPEPTRNATPLKTTQTPSPVSKPVLKLHTPALLSGNHKLHPDVEERNQKLEQLLKKRPVNIQGYYQPPAIAQKLHPMTPTQVMTPTQQLPPGFPQPSQGYMRTSKMIEQSLEKLKKKGNEEALKEIQERDQKLMLFLSKAAQHAPPVVQSPVAGSSQRSGRPDLKKYKPGPLNLKIHIGKGGLQSGLNTPMSARVPNSAFPQQLGQHPSLSQYRIDPGQQSLPSALPQFAPHRILEAHKLEHEWSLYYDRRGMKGIAKSHGQNFEDNLISICTVRSVEMFWSYFNQVKVPSLLEMNSNLHLFKDGIKPMWEDPANSQGSKWTIGYSGSPALLDQHWQLITLGLIGETLDDGDEICGAVVSRRPKGDRIAIWMRSRNNHDAHFTIGTRLVNLLGLTDTSLTITMEFLYHSDAMRTGGSYHSGSLAGKMNLSLESLRASIRKGLNERRASISMEDLMKVAR